MSVILLTIDFAWFEIINNFPQNSLVICILCTHKHIHMWILSDEKLAIFQKATNAIYVPK